MPCFHKCLCEECARDFCRVEGQGREAKACPICRAAVLDAVKIFE
jgi:hypothetical protein